METKDMIVYCFLGIVLAYMIMNSYVNTNWNKFFFISTLVFSIFMIWNEIFELMKLNNNDNK